MEIKVTKKHENVVIPQYATEGAAGFDFVADSFIQLYENNQLNICILTRFNRQKKRKNTQINFVKVPTTYNTQLKISISMY